ncbi:hypothetical protein HYH02_010224 [Chlamydomonas schloesseri]|uniref:Uncharacterized protein n=1 Tax=Chlamydomonas schloesseri TaxID=2026947 RepID=A0A835TMW3_9CHLO|nr:hypothetical protein HYH02_010224 [Chlamydomonas schloesseri]|eukprot:KAG2440645.1 hypothetical protein HYH02_010224 [Chlamydomonas schloesseri]
MLAEPSGGVATLTPLRTSLAGSSPAPSLRASLSGVPPSGGASAAPSPHTSGSKPRVSTSGTGGNPRMSSPGVLANAGASPALPSTAPQHLPPMRAISTATGNNGTAGTNASSDLPRLTTRQSESGGGKDVVGMKPSPPNLRRAATMVRSVDSGLSSSGGPGPASAAMGAARGDAIIKERRALQQDKNALALNKKRLEALLARAAEALPPSADDAAASSGVRGGSGGSLRAQIQKALDESGQLDKHISSNPGSGMILFEAEAEAKVRQLTAQMADMKMDHEVALSRLEGELKYRNTQSSAAASGLQKQLSEAEEELSRVRRAHDVEIARARELSSQVQDLTRQLHEANSSLQDKTAQVKDMTELMGMDKVTMNTVLEMLRSQLKEAKAEAEARQERVKELEYALVHRDTLLSEAQQRLSAAGLSGGWGAAHLNGVGYEEARVSSSPIDGKSAWGKVAHAVAGMRSNHLASGTGLPGRMMETASGMPLVASSMEAPKGVLSA